MIFIKNSWLKTVSLVILVGITVFSIFGCDAENQGETAATERPEGWTEETHSNNVDPDYDTVFPQDSVNEIKITISPENWEAMQTNMEELFGAAGNQQGNQIPGAVNPRQGANLLPDAGNVTMPGRPGGLLPDTGNLTLPRQNLPEGFVPPADNVTRNLQPNQGNQGVPGWVDMTSENPDWVEATIEFGGLEWTNVGIRYKGNSSLTSSWRSGSINMPFKLDFDQFEDEYPSIDNQRFYGFKQLSFSNSFNDATYMRDTLGSDILKDAGLPAAETAYYHVILDYGEGEVDLGIYIAIEVVDDTVIESYFGDDSGNIYEGDGAGVNLAEGVYNLIQNSFAKENNEDEADWSDIYRLYDILHDDTRTTDPAAWRAELESVFDVDSYLEWLAIAAIIQHWDTYGSMSHNFYLFDDPDTGRLTWISWDHNQILEGGGGIGAAGNRMVGGIRASSALSLGRDEVTAQWPLIRYLLDDPVYYEKYLGYLETAIEGPFNPDNIAAECSELASLLSPYIPEDETFIFNNAVQALVNRIYARYQVTLDFLTEVK